MGPGTERQSSRGFESEMSMGHAIKTTDLNGGLALVFGSMGQGAVHGQSSGTVVTVHSPLSYKFPQTL